MTLRDSVFIDALPQDVWPHVADPARAAQWNPKIVNVNRTEEGPLTGGEEYEMEYEMAGRRTPFRATVIELAPPRRLVLRLRQPDWPAHRYVDQAYELTTRRGGTRLRQLVDLRHSGLRWPVRALLWLLDRFGKKTKGKTPYLERLKQLVEQD